MIEIKMKDVSIGYRQSLVVKNMTLEARPGEMLGLVGPNGCGKSTIIKALSRLIQPQSGNILVNERNILQMSRIELARIIGVVPQIPLLPSTFTAFDIVLMGRNPHLGLLQHEGKKDVAIAWEAMRKTATRPLAQRRIGELSGGEIQSVVIARVLAQQTEAVLLDEPTANLDIGRQIEVLDLIKELCQGNGFTVVIALHDLNLAAQYCDHLILIDKGSIHCQGKPDKVITTDNIANVYGSGSYIYEHPLSGLPVVLPIAGSSKSYTE
ncbi:MAG TPA: ABC transporter ATP-binding protein [Dehalococcoidia bacterium]|nr:ABC transporter ATP-binding protein [Dehalococcoidia bacterium]